MDSTLFMQMLSVDSTSGSERKMAEKLASLLKTEKNTAQLMEVGDGTLNLLLKWGEPRVMFCTHMDTVPPYIAPVMENINKGDMLPDGKVAQNADVIVRGRGSCDAKGQIFAMYEACLELEKQGKDGFGLLILAGEETGSFGAKAYNRDYPGVELVVVGEPTENKMVTSSKGTKSFGVSIKGKPCHSGYPQLGESAVMKFCDMIEDLRRTNFPEDDILGPTTWNVGKLVSDNPQNILSPLLECRIYFRTTFASDAFVVEKMLSYNSEDITVTPYGGDTPIRYYTRDGIEQTTVAFGSDAPQLHKFGARALCGPGSIMVAHKDEEYVLLGDIEKAKEIYISIFQGF